jgi:hypothetical protein
MEAVSHLSGVELTFHTALGAIVTIIRLGAIILSILLHGATIRFTHLLVAITLIMAVLILMHTIRIIPHIMATIMTHTTHMADHTVIHTTTVNLC